jgi:hypothetical protein
MIRWFIKPPVLVIGFAFFDTITFQIACQQLNSVIR